MSGIAKIAINAKIAISESMIDVGYMQTANLEYKMKANSLEYLTCLNAQFGILALLAIHWI